MGKIFVMLLIILSIGNPSKAARLSPNFHTVYENELYRSAQLHKNEFKEKIRKHGIKTIINLRGVSASDWYEDEKSVTEEMGVRLISIRMSAKRLPHRDDLLKLIASFETAERPILIHCQAGADRTGEAAAMYLIDFKNKSKEEAVKMLSPRYLHLRAFTPAKTYFIENVYQGKEWAEANYEPCNSEYKYYDKQKFCTP